MLECCKHRTTTPFCPLCGKRLHATSPLDGLLMHVSKQITNKRRVLEVIAGGIAELSGDDPRAERQQKRMAGMQNTLEKWEGWRDALQGLLLASQEQPHATEDLPGR